MRARARPLFAGLGLLSLLAVFAWHRSSRTAEVSTKASSAVRTFDVARLPADCTVRVEVNLRELFAQPAMAASKQSPLALAGVLAGSSKQHRLEDLKVLTQSGSLSDITKLSVCQVGTSGSFVAVMSGSLKPGGLKDLSHRFPTQWQSVQIAGALVSSHADQQPPFLMQAADTSLLLASSRDHLEKALSAPAASSSYALPPDGASLWASMNLAIKRNLATKPATGLDMAQRATVRMDFGTRKVAAVLQFAPGTDTTAAAGQLRAFLAQSGKGHEHGNESRTAVAYLAKRAIVSAGSDSIVIESELNDAAVAWLPEQIAKRARLGGD